MIHRNNKDHLILFVKNKANSEFLKILLLLKS